MRAERRREMERSKEVEGGGEQLVLPHRREEHTEEPPPLHRDGAGKPPSLTKGGSDPVLTTSVARNQVTTLATDSFASSSRSLTPGADEDESLASFISERHFLLINYEILTSVYKIYITV